MKKPILCFGIPTWNRAEHLRVCVTNIAEQIVASPTEVRIFISDNASDDHTAEVVKDLQKKYKFIDYTLMEKHGDFADNLFNVFSKVKGEYCWLFGDDDVILPNALTVILDVLKNGVFDFVHCCDAARASTEPKVVSASLFDLCNQLGWLEITGFLSSCVVRTTKLNAVAHSTTWPFYRQNAYPHACHFLETMARSQAAVVDAPMVALQSPVQTDDTRDRWRQENIGSRYFFVVHALPVLVAQAAMPSKVNERFFRYHRYYLWNKFVTTIIYEVYNSSSLLPDDMWNSILSLLDYLDDSELVRRLRGEIDMAREACLTLLSTRRLTEFAGITLNAHFDHLNRSPLTYVLTAP